MNDNSDILFVGWGTAEGVSHYRTILPAKTMGAEYVIIGMDGRPVCGEGSRKHHELIIVQNCWADWQLKIVQKMKERGSKVIFNVDDWIKAIGRREGSHGHAAMFRSRKVLDLHERIWAACDGAIVSTEWIAKKALGLTDQIEVARNGIDPARYTPWMDVKRDMGTIIGWAGGTGHRDSLRSISNAVSSVVNEYPEVSLWIVGQDESDVFDCDTYHVKWSDMYLYPQQLACFDINLAPAMENDFYRAKSQLRLYEAWTLGTPTVASPLYDEITDGVDGLLAWGAGDFYAQLNKIVKSKELQASIREASIEKSKEVTIDARINEWERAIESLRG